MINKSNLYDLLYAKADKLLKEYNPCRINKDLFGGVYCKKYDNDDLCCGGGNGKCKYLSDTGCTTKCLGCKLGLCMSDSRYSVLRGFHKCCNKFNINSIFEIKMSKLIKIAEKYELIILRSSKEEMLSY